MFQTNTRVELLTDVNIPRDYQYTLNFKTLYDQENYFDNRIAKIFGNGTSLKQVSQGGGEVIVNSSLASLLGFNYMRIMNDSNKWYYCFIDSVEMVSSATTRIYYTVDVMQTYFIQGDVTLGDCFVEREHVDDDTVGNHLLDEGLNIGQDYETVSEYSYYETQYKVVILASEPINGLNAKVPQKIGGIAVPCYSYWLGYDDLDQIKFIVDAYATAGKSDAIISIFTQPANFSADYNNPNCVKNKITVDITPTIPYVCKNNKMKTFPFTFLSCESVENSQVFKFENFKKVYTDNFVIQGTFGENQSLLCYPTDYLRFIKELTNEPLAFATSCSGFPVLPWVSNYYSNWQARTSAGRQLQKESIDINKKFGLISGGMGLVGSAGAMAINPVAGAGGMVASGVGIANTLSQSYLAEKQMMVQDYEAQMIPNSFSASTVSANTIFADRKIGFTFKHKVIRSYFFKKCDTFLTKYGYKVLENKTPNINSRERFNYLKVSDIYLFGDLANEQKELIKSIFTNGITFWHDHENIGNYDIENTIREV